MKRGVSDRETKDLWREYQVVVKMGNPYGLSFVEYITARVNARQPMTFTDTDNVPWYVATCGHMHPLGAGCSQSVTT